MSKNKKSAPILRSPAAEYLSFVAASGEGGVEAVYDVETHTINYHLKKIFSDSELEEDAVIRNFRITAKDSKSYNTKHYSLSATITATDRKVLQDAGKVSAEIAKAHAISEFEKYRIVQDRLYQSDFDKQLKALESLEKRLTKHGGSDE